MRKPNESCWVVLGILVLGGLPTRMEATTLEVGPGKPYATIEKANATARPGDLILVYPLENDKAYEKTAIMVRQKNLTFRAVPAKPGAHVCISGEGMEYSGVGSVPRAIFQFNPGADGCVLEGFELTGAHNTSHNGAGIRINEANQVTIRDCRIHGNDMGVMSNGRSGERTGRDQRIERCAIHQNGSLKDPGQNHNLYLGGTNVTLRFCEVHGSLTGHNVKSRAHHTRLEYCYIHHASNREIDLVDGWDTTQAESDAVVLGCVIVKDPECRGNRAVIHFGQDVGKGHVGTIYLVGNTIVTPFMSAVLTLSSERVGASLVGNMIHDGGQKQKNQVLAQASGAARLVNVVGHHNWLSGSFAIPEESKLDRASLKLQRATEPLFVNPKQHDYRLKASTAARTNLQLADVAVPKSLDSEAPKEPPLCWEYRHPRSSEARKPRGGFSYGAAEPAP